MAQDAAAPPAPGVQSADTVRALQQKLGISADGVYGPKTRAAVKRFQRAHGLTADGVAGPRTLAALGVTAAAPEPQAEASDTLGGPRRDADGTLQRIAQCESGGNPTAVSADGTYRGKYQFDRTTWREMGGTGDPADAPEAEQDRIAAQLLAQRGTAPWPVCGDGRPAVRATPCAPRPRRRTARGRPRAAPRCG